MAFSVKFELIDVNSGETVCTLPVQTKTYGNMRQTVIDALDETVTNNNNI